MPSGSGWLTSAAEPALCLPTLMRRLAHLQELETNFAAKLEFEILASLKELAYGASHEINNPLANIATRAQTLLRDERDPERRRKLATINAQAFRAHEMISDMMLFARPPQLRPGDDGRSFRWSRRSSPNWRPMRNCRVHRSGLADEPARLDAVVDREQMAVVVKAICRNALEAIGQGGSVVIELYEKEVRQDDDSENESFHKSKRRDSSARHGTRNFVGGSPAPVRSLLFGS